MLAARYPPLSDTQKDHIQQDLAHGLSPDVIAETEHASARAVRRIRLNIATFSHHTAPQIGKKGAPFKITLAARNLLRSFLESKPSSYLDEMQCFLFDELDIHVSLDTVSRTLRSMKISRKNLRRLAAERSQICRDDYMLAVSHFTHDMLVFLDESAANEHTAHRKRGWAACGIKPSVYRPLKRSKRRSILPAYTSSGILAYHIH